MLTDNLQEMIRQPDENPFGSPAVQETTEQDTVSTDKVLTWDDQIEPQKRQTEDVKKEHEITPIMNPADALTSNFQAKSEEDLIQHTKYLYAQMEVSVVMTYWHIGQAINSFYQKDYGHGKLKRIADETGIKLDTLHKAGKFARDYSEERVKELLQGRFVIAWNHIAQNLSIKPENLIAVYRSSDSPGEFHNGIMKFKSPHENRGKTKKVCEESGQDSSFPGQEMAESEVPDSSNVTEDTEQEITVELEPVRVLEDETSPLRDELITKQQQIEALEKTVDEMKSVIEEKEEALSTIRKGLERVRSMAQDDASLWEILDVLEDLYSTI